MPFSRATSHDVAADAEQLLPDVRRRVADRRRDLEHRLHELGVDARLELVAGDGGEHRVDVLDEVERLAVEEHVLLLDAERVRVALAEGVVEDAAARREARALAGDRRVGSSESRHRGDRYPLALQEESTLSGEDGVRLDLDEPRRIEQSRDDDHRRGRPDSPKTSPCARTDRLPVGGVGDVERVCGRRAPGRLRARAERATTISRHRFACVVRVGRVAADRGRARDVDAGPARTARE